jgi:hypothetical protein
MATVGDLVADVRRRVYGSMTENVNLVQTSASAGQTSLQLELGVDGIQKGMLISSGLNVWFVKGVYSTDNTVFVIPGVSDVCCAASGVDDDEHYPCPLALAGDYGCVDGYGSPPLPLELQYGAERCAATDLYPVWYGN